MAFGLTATGYTPRRAADYLDLIREAYTTETGLTIDFDSDVFLGHITSILADRLGEIDEVLEAVYDARDPANSTGLQLDNLSRVVGVERIEATKSVATVTSTGLAGTIITAGRLIEGGGEFDKARWITTTDVTIPVGLTIDHPVESTVFGATAASPADIDLIITPVNGWTSVTNAASASPGRARETDNELRSRRRTSIKNLGSRSLDALRADLVALSFIDSAVVLDNPTPLIALIQGIVMQPHSMQVVLFPITAVTEQLDDIAEIIYDHAPAGILVQQGPSPVVVNVTGADGFLKVVSWIWATTLTVDVAYTLTLEPGFSLTDVNTPLTDAVVKKFDELAVGESLDILDMLTIAGAINGIKGATVTLNAGAVDIEPFITQLIIKGTIAIA